MHMAVEGSQCKLSIAKFQLAEGCVDDLPVHLERLDWRHLDGQLKQCGGGPARCGDGDAVLPVCCVDQALESPPGSFDPPLPAFQAFLLTRAAHPSPNDAPEQPLEFATLT